MPQSTNMRPPARRLTLGVCYYPEHWDETLWPDDLRRMKQSGISFVRVGEFAWALFEPSEGIFDFGLFDRFLALAAREGMNVVFGTPTATPPAWLTERYPEVLNADIDGRTYRHGLRRHCNYNAPQYRRLTSVIVEKLAERFGSHPSVIGWQIDNELNCETDVFYAPADHEAFRVYLKEKFGTLERFNESMGTVFWSQTYTSWEQVHLPRTMIHNSPNPHLALEEKRFISRSAVSFCALQADILRRHIGEDRFITTNGLFGHLDYTELTGGPLDFVCYDSYPNFAHALEPDDRFPLDDRFWSHLLGRTRSFSPHFGVMEQQSGANGWTNRMESPAPKPGQMRLWTLQSVAHGADFISYFRWRTAPFGTEIYWHGLNDYDNRPGRKIEELNAVARDFTALRDLAGASFRADVAVVTDCDNEFDGSLDRWSSRLNGFSAKGLFEGAQTTHTPCDQIRLRPDTSADELSRYRLLFYPHPMILGEPAVETLRRYVEAGGQLVFGCRAGLKDEFGRCPMRPLPGPAASLCGVEVADFTFVGPHDAPQKALWNGAEIDAPLFSDILAVTAPDTRVEAVFAGNYYDGRPALTSRAVGRGRVYYWGAAFSPETTRSFLHILGLAAPYARRYRLPPSCELVVREKDGRNFAFVLNYAGVPADIKVLEPSTDLLTGADVLGSMTLPAYGAAVLTARR